MISTRLGSRNCPDSCGGPCWHPTMSTLVRRRAGRKRMGGNMIFGFLIRWLDPAQESQLEPFPMAIDVFETDLAEPIELSVHAHQFVGRILIDRRDSERIQISCMQFGAGGRDMLQITEHASGIERR